MICPNCASDNEAAAKFCNECGTGLSAGCPNCGATNKPGAKFCNECGTALASSGPPVRAAAQSAAPQSVAERRLVTVLFADIVGFTPFAEERDAEDVRETLSRYFDLCSDIITRYGGTIEKFIGDAVMAVWGAPTAHEDDAERAVRAALDLIQAVHTLEPHAQARAGVLTGEAAVTIGATNQGMVAGDLVNTAARLQSVAAPGAVLVGEATFRASSGAIAFEPAGEQALKGKQSPVPAWRATRVVAERGGRNRSEGLEAPFVGREDEVRLLKDLFHATARETKVRLVSVMGPAGIGKSRLAWEFLKYVDGLVETTYWHNGRSPAYGDGITFWALGEMVRGRCQLVESDDEATTRRKVSETVAQWVSDEAERRWIEPALLSLLGVESGIASEQLFAAWRTFFERISAGGTVTLVFEDLHFADAGVLDFVDHMLEWSRGFPIYVVTLSRPELLDRRPDWGAGKRNFTSLYLEPLAEAEMRELLAGLAPGLPVQAVGAIVNRADGIPLYAVETVRMLVADGRLVERDGAYAPVGDLTSLAVPETLTALIASRLDGLDPSDRAVIHDAAVLGQSFTLAGLAAVSGVPEAELDERVRGLLRRELLTRDMDARSPERGQFAFVQALIREVAYNTLARPDRKMRHLAAARYFEQIGSDELAGALAGHYLSAYRNAAEGAEADALAGQARIALKAAADRAVALGSHEQAIVFIEQALTVTDDEAELADMLEKAAQSASAAARRDRSEPLFRRAIETHLRAGNRVGAARATGALGWDLINDKRTQDAQAVLSDAATEYADLWPDPVLVLLKVQLARAYNSTEQHALGLALSDEALAAAEHADLVPVIAKGLIGKGMALGGIGRLREAIALIRAGEDLARENDLDETLLRALVVRGMQMAEVDNQAVLEAYREGLALSRRTGRRSEMFGFVNNFGYTAFLVGEWDEALAELDSALAEELGIADRTWLMSNALIIRACRGESVADGLAELDRLVALHGDPEIILPTLDARGNEALAAGRLREAREYWLRYAKTSAASAPAWLYQAARPALWSGELESVREDAAALDATGFHGRVVEVRRTTLSAGIASLEGRSTEAVQLYLEALRRWRELGMVWDEALTGIDMVSLLDPAGPHVRAAGQSTREILERLDAKPYIERLENALNRPAAQPIAGTSTATAPTQSVAARSG